MSEFLVPLQHVKSLVLKLERLKRKCLELNCEPPTWVVGCVETVYRSVMDVPGGRGVTYDACRVTVVGSAPSLNGWRLVGVLSHLPNGVLLCALPGEEFGVFYRKRENESSLRLCDYCLTDRDRKKTFLVRSLGGDDERVVGASCLKDFLGHPDPGQYAKLAARIGGLGEELRGLEDDWGASLVPAVEVEAYVSWVALHVRRDHKYWSRAKVEDNETGGRSVTTADAAWFDMHDEGGVEGPSKADVLVAREAIEWSKTVDPEASEYEHNLVVALSSGYVSAKTKGIVASVLPAYRRATREPTPVVDGEWFGEVGERVEVDVRVVSRNKFSGQFGESEIVTFATLDGHVFKWFASGKVGFAEREWVRVKGTVKKHDYYRGQKQTVLSRVKVAGGF